MTGESTDLSLLISQALQKHKSRDFPGARLLYRQVLSQDPNHADALHLYGCLCADEGSLGEAAEFLTLAVERNPNAYPYFYNLANVLVKRGALDEAERRYKDAVRLKPDYAMAHHNLGLTLLKQRHYTEAKTCFQTVLQLQPNFADAHYHLGLRQMADGKIQEAIGSYLEAIRCRPDYADAHYNLGNAYATVQRPSDALAAFVVASRIRPENAQILTNMGGELLKLGRVDAATEAFRHALRIDPDDTLTRSNMILAECYATTNPIDIYKQCKQWQLFQKQPTTRDLGMQITPFDNAKRLKIGYVSGDFRHHAAAYWIEPLLAGHQHSDFYIYCYSNNDQTDDVTNRLKAYADIWVECASLADDALCERIRKDEIDILVDLSGHTGGNRLPVFARKPAVVQVSWFGFPVSTGLLAMDYRFSDHYIDPVGQFEHCYSEKLIRLDRFYAAFRPEADAPDVGVSPFLRNGFVTFASLNSLAKITPAMQKVWAEILIAQPNSHLLIQAAGLEDSLEKNRILDFFQTYGILPDRLTLRGWTNIESFLLLGRDADIALDPFPFNGGVTSCHALWMGLPLVTQTGQSAASRVGGSLLNNIGLPELIAGTSEQYHQIAVELATDTARLTTLRATMRERMATSGLLDGEALARQAEAEYRRMWLAIQPTRRK